VRRPRRSGTTGVVLALAGLLLLAPGSATAALLAAGDPFPAWSLQAHDGTTVSSTQLAGKRYVLWFYPRAMTPGCTVEGRGFRDQFEEFRTQKIAVFGVSFDDVAANARFAADEGFPFPLLSDTTRALAVAVGAADDASQSAARRISYVVGVDGRVERAYGTVTPAQHPATILRDARGSHGPAAADDATGRAPGKNETVE
jgi:peroxiredoxin Q/BCP